jgi:hypothetical protein
LITVALIILIPGSLQEVWNNFHRGFVGAGSLRLLAIAIGGAGRIIECHKHKKSFTETIPEIVLFSLNGIQIVQWFVYN